MVYTLNSICWSHPGESGYHSPSIKNRYQRAPLLVTRMAAEIWALYLDLTRHSTTSPREFWSQRYLHTFLLIPCSQQWDLLDRKMPFMPNFHVLRNVNLSTIWDCPMPPSSQHFELQKTPKEQEMLKGCWWAQLHQTINSYKSVTTTLTWGNHTCPVHMCVSNIWQKRYQRKTVVSVNSKWLQNCTVTVLGPSETTTTRSF
jgi:hypothetical protein